MDATYGTNSAGMDLFAVPAEVDGSGVPLCYMFVQKGDAGNGRGQTAEGTMTAFIKAFLLPLKTCGFNPHFFGTDKDKSEIDAVRHTWPESKHQLCWWQVKRAIRSKLTKSDNMDALARYYPPGLHRRKTKCWQLPTDI